MQPLPDDPLISIVMPVFNAGKFLRESIDSILNQSYKNFELLIADDGSTDNSIEILACYRDSRIKTFHNKKNKGYLKTCNKLFAEAKGQLVTFQDADDISVLNRLEVQLRCFIANPDLGMCTSNYILINEDGSVKKVRSWQIDYEKLRTADKPDILYCGATIMIRREVLEKVGYYREFFDRLGFEDFDWLYRIIEKYKAIHLPQHLYKYRIHPSAVKTHNIDFRIYTIPNIVLFLRQQRLTSGKDSLQTGNLKPLRERMAMLEAPFLRDPSHILRIESGKAINTGKLFKGILLAMKAVYKNPLLFTNYENFARCVYASLRKLLLKE